MDTSPYDFDVVTGPPEPREEGKERSKEEGAAPPTPKTPAGEAGK